MSATNELENDLLALLFNNADATFIGDAAGLLASAGAGNWWISLHTADPGEAGDQTTSECAYTGYGRVSVARDASWTVSGTAPTQVVNAGAVTFGICTGAAPETATHFGIGYAQTLAGHLKLYGQLTAPLVINVGVTPSFAAGALKVTLD